MKYSTACVYIAFLIFLVLEYLMEVYKSQISCLFYLTLKLM